MKSGRKPEAGARRSLAVGVAVAAAVAGALTLAPGAKAQWGTGGSLYTETGVEISVDARVVTLFAMLNALGYDHETVFGPEPIKRPRYAEARRKARSALPRPGPGLKRLEQLIAKAEVPAARYAKSALALSGAPKFKAKGRVTKLTKRLEKPMDEWFNKEGGSAIYAQVASTAKGEQRLLLKALNKRTQVLRKTIRVGSEEEEILSEDGPKLRVVIVVNPLDAHGALDRLDVGDKIFILAGPFADDNQRELALDATALAYARSLVTRDAAEGSGQGSIAADLHGALSKKQKRAMPKPADVGAELLACAALRELFPKSACSGSPVADRKEQLDLIAPRMKAWIADTTMLNEAAAGLLAGAAPPPVDVPPGGAPAGGAPPAKGTVPPAKPAPGKAAPPKKGAPPSPATPAPTGAPKGTK